VVYGICSHQVSLSLVIVATHVRCPSVRLHLRVAGCIAPWLTGSYADSADRFEYILWIDIGRGRGWEIAGYSSTKRAIVILCSRGTPLGFFPDGFDDNYWDRSGSLWGVQRVACNWFITYGQVGCIRMEREAKIGSTSSYVVLSVAQGVADHFHITSTF